MNIIKQILKEEADKNSDSYKEFFQKTLKKYNVSSPSELSDEDKKKFFTEIEDGWKADGE